MNSNYVAEIQSTSISDRQRVRQHLCIRIQVALPGHMWPGVNAALLSIVRTWCWCLCVSDPVSCGVVGPPIQGESVTLSCSMAYTRKGVENKLNPGGSVSASISWESAAGTFVSNSSTPMADDAGATLTVDVTMVASGREIPAYTCTSAFEFTAAPSTFFTYALNSLSWPCTTTPVPTWCKYCNSVKPIYVSDPMKTDYSHSGIAMGRRQDRPTSGRPTHAWTI